MRCIVCKNGIFTLENMSSIMIEKENDEWKLTMDYCLPCPMSVILYRSTDKRDCEFVLGHLVCQLKDGKDILQLIDFNGSGTER